MNLVVLKKSSEEEMLVGGFWFGKCMCASVYSLNFVLNFHLFKNYIDSFHRERERECACVCLFRVHQNGLLKCGH